MIIAVYLVLGAVTLASTAPTPNLCQHQDQPPGESRTQVFGVTPFPTGNK